MDFSWRATRAHGHVPDGTYAGATFDQHSMGWCGCCYIVAAVQAIEDRGHIARPQNPRHTVDMQTVLDHFSTSASAEGSAWNACHGGSVMHVVKCLVSRACPLLTTRHKRWLGHPSRTARTPLSTAPYRVASVTRFRTRDVLAELYRHGPVILEINANTLKSCDRDGVVTDLAPAPPNHAVSVVGWRHTQSAGLCWIVRNSWGQNRVPVDIPDDTLCVDKDGNRCEVEWTYWAGDPANPGFCYLPMSYPMLHTSDPWIVPHVLTNLDRNV